MNKQVVNQQVIRFTTETRVYTQNGTIDVKDATDIEFNNSGDNALRINNRTIAAGDWWAINSFPFEINNGNYKVEFVGATTGVLEVTVRRYLTNPVQSSAIAKQ